MEGKIKILNALIKNDKESFQQSWSNVCLDLSW